MDLYTEEYGNSKKNAVQGTKSRVREANLTNARNMKALGLDISIISQVTGLTLEEINAL